MCVCGVSFRFFKRKETDLVVYNSPSNLPNAVRAPISTSSYALDIIPQSSPSQLWPEDEGVLRDLLAATGDETTSTCCMQPGTCSKLKSWLAEGNPAVGVCYQDGNLCSKEGRLLALDLSHQVRLLF